MPEVTSQAPQIAQQCLQCHGVKGPGLEAQPKIPRLGGQQKEYIVQQLERFKWRERIDPTDQMNDIAGRMTENEMQEAASYYASDHGLLHEETKAVNGREATECIRGGELAKTSCNSCHMNAELKGRSSDRLVPLLGGQSKQYLMNQLLYFRNNERTSPLMHEYASELTNQNIEDLATYFSLY